MKIYYPKEYKTLLKLGIPISIGHIGMTLQNVVDNIMVGRHSTAELAAAGFVNSLFILALLLSVGFSQGSISQIGALYTQNKKGDISEMLKNSIAANFFQGLFVMLLLAFLYFLLPYMGQPAELLPLMKPYLLIQIFSLPFVFMGSPFKQMTDSINDTSVSMIATLAANVWNIFFNWVLIYGNLGFPEMGITGAALATFSSRFLMLVIYVAVFFLRPKYKEYVGYWKDVSVSREKVGLLARLGWPIAVQTTMEAASFTIVVIFIGWFGTNQLAAHEVMISLSNVVFMAFMGFSNAVAIRVSNYNGLNDMQGVKDASVAGYEIVVVISAVVSALIFYFRHEVALLFTDSREVASIVAACVIPLILYQVGDGLQCTFSNALRGLGDVEKLMKYSIIAYIVVSIPLSFLFGVVMKLGTLGIWMGFPFGLSTAAFLFVRRFLKVVNYKVQ